MMPERDDRRTQSKTVTLDVNKVMGGLAVAGLLGAATIAWGTVERSTQTAQRVVVVEERVQDHEQRLRSLEQMRADVRVTRQKVEELAEALDENR